MNEQKTLRDEFAMATLIGAISNPADPRESYDVYVERAYAMADAMLAERSKNAPKDDDNGWIEWNGGECPVAEKCCVEIRSRGGVKVVGKASDWWWTHDFGSSDIIAYRVKVIK